MQTPAKITKTIVRIESENYLVRTVKLDDASDRWASWMSDPEAVHMLNAPAKTLHKSDIVKYIKQFDQRSRLLLGIFTKQSSRHIGIITFNIDFALRQFLVNMLIGEPQYRNHGVTNEITEPCREYLFETLGMKKMLCTALARNHIIIHYLLKTGWKLEQTRKQHVKSRSDGTMLDLCFFSLAREDWRARKRAELAARQEAISAGRESGSDRVFGLSKRSD